jgi:hypothetical protein
MPTATRTQQPTPPVGISLNLGYSRGWGGGYYGRGYRGWGGGYRGGWHR